MDIPKYSQTAVELLRRIRRGVYTDKLPPIRELAAEFDIAMQTMFNAVQLLVKKELLIPCGSGGMLIDRGKLPCGFVAITVYDTMLPYCSLAFENLLRQISEDGYTPIFLGVPRQQQLFLAERLFKADIAGVIFLYSAINPEFCEVLGKQHTPFVSANIIPGVKNVNFVECDTFIGMDFLVKQLYEKGYRKIAINLVSPLEGYVRFCSCRWRKILEKYDLPYSSHNSFRDEFPVELDKECFENVAVEPLKNKDDLPDAVINWSGSGIKIIKKYAGTGGLQLLNVNSIKNMYVPENAVRFSAECDNVCQRKELWDLLLSILIGGTCKTVHRFLDNIKICLHDKIPYKGKVEK
ncbi:MAG: GntR family transcriptional regulator [Lentisphaerae bacterium]|nr:GntR family transcriptional regulator [Lentisphaerota bacterium]